MNTKESDHLARSHGPCHRPSGLRSGHRPATFESLREYHHGPFRNGRDEVEMVSKRE